MQKPLTFGLRIIKEIKNKTPKSMAKSHFEYYAETIRNLYYKSIDNSNKVSENFDKVIVWIVGFSIGGIALLVSQSDKLQMYSPGDLNIIAVSLTLAVLFGVIGRISYAICLRLSYPITMQIESQLLAYENPYKATKLKGDESAENILYLLKVDFDLEAKGLEQKISNSTTESKSKLDEEARAFYQQYVDWTKTQRETSQKLISDVFVNALKLKKKEAMDYSEGKKLKPKLMRFTGKIASYSYLICCIAFVWAITFFAGAFIFRGA
jgi:hypothetical protein